MNKGKILKILCIDDEQMIRNTISDYLEDAGYRVVTAANGIDGLDLFHREQPDVVLVDINMPGMHGLDVLASVQKKNSKTPVIVISGTGNIKDVVDALRLGAWDYITKPIEDMVVIEYAIVKSLERAQLLQENRLFHEDLQIQVHNRTHELLEANEDLKRMLWETVKALTLMTEKKDPYTSGHQKRVAQLAVGIAEEMGFAPEFIEGIRVAGMLHDIGKIYVPHEFLSKPIALEVHEMEVIRQHSVVGYDILQNIPFPWPVAEIVHQHHERLNGSGYPKHLKGDQILMEAQIISIADVVEAISSHRPYRPALGLQIALEEIDANKGILYHPDCVAACIRLLEKDSEAVLEIKQSFR